MQELKFDLPIVKCLPKWDKQTRLMVSSHNIESGNFLVPLKAKWLPDFEKELLSFPYVAHDDQVDALTQFFLWYRKKKSSEFKIRLLELQD